MSEKDKEHTDIAELSDELAILKKKAARSIIIIGVLILLAGILSLIIGTIKDDSVFKLCGGILLFMSGWTFYKYG